jgi:hypothetical protein
MMHQERKTSLRSSHAIARWEQTLRETEQRESEDRMLFDRELFYAMQPRERLENLSAQYAVAFG